MSSLDSGYTNPMIDGQVHGDACKCKRCKTGRRSNRQAQCINLCRLLVGVGVLIAIGCLATRINTTSSKIDTFANAIRCESRVPAHTRFNFLPQETSLQVTYAIDFVTVMRLANTSQAQAALEAMNPNSFQIVAPIVVFLSGSNSALQTSNRAIGDDGYLAPRYRHEYVFLVLNIANDEVGFVVIDNFSEQPETVADYWGPDSTHVGRIYSSVSHDGEKDRILMRAKENGPGGYDVELEAVFDTPDALLMNRVIDDPADTIIYFPNDVHGRPVRARESRYQDRYQLCDRDEETPAPECSEVFTKVPESLSSRGVRVDLGSVLCGQVRFIGQNAFWRVPFDEDPEGISSMNAAEIEAMSIDEAAALMMNL